MIRISMYLNFDGQTEEAFNFYKSVFGGEFSVVQRNSETPFADKLPANERNRIMHVSLPIGNTDLMGSDILPSMGHKLNTGNNSHLAISPDSQAEADRIFKALSPEGKLRCRSRRLSGVRSSACS